MDISNSGANSVKSLFNDFDNNHWAYNAVYYLKGNGIINGYNDGSFKPDKGVAKWRVIRGYRAVTEP